MPESSVWTLCRPRVLLQVFHVVTRNRNSLPVERCFAGLKKAPIDTGATISMILRIGPSNFRMFTTSPTIWKIWKDHKKGNSVEATLIVQLSTAIFLPVSMSPMSPCRPVAPVGAEWRTHLSVFDGGWHDLSVGLCGRVLVCRCVCRRGIPGIQSS